MNRTKTVLAAFFVPVTALACAVSTGLTSANAAASRLCGRWGAVSVSRGAYVVQNNEYHSAAAQCLNTSGGTAFSVASSSVSVSPRGVPGSYPSVFAGCSWNHCSHGGLAARPVRLSAIRPGTATSSWSTAQPARRGEAFDAAYDIWISPSPRVAGQPRGSEIMIWLNHRGGMSPAGHRVARGARIGGRAYDIWYLPPAGGAGNIVSYVMTRPTGSVSRLDLSAIFRNSVGRGYTKPAWYLTAVEAGFELWRGGAGLATRSFSVRVP